MEFINHTPYPAMLFRSILPGERMLGSLACRVTYDLAGDELHPAAEQVWKVSPGPWGCAYGPLPGVELVYRGGTDVFVFGSARPPGDRPAPRVDVSVSIGDRFRHTVAVFGDRQWEKRNGRFVASRPRPFTDIPLTLANAFGGADVW